MRVQGMSTSSLINPGRGRVYGNRGNPTSRRHYGLLNGSRITGANDQFSLWNYTVQNLFPKGHACVPRWRNKRVEARWPFNGDERGMDASSERSESANEDILVFFFQLDLATRLQYALNLEQYDIAQQLRDKLNEVESEVVRQQESKRGSTSKSEVQNQAIHILRLRAELQNAIENENYTQAAKLRDEISTLEAESLVASAKAMAYDNVRYKFRLGQKVRHKLFGYRGVICGMDPVCCESSSWKETANVDKLAQGSAQPFYQVLVDVYEDPDLLVAYVAQENLVLPEQPDMSRFDHPYTSFLFYGTDTAGDFIPVQQLCEKYNQPRHEVPFDPDDEDGQQDA